MENTKQEKKVGPVLSQNPQCSGCNYIFQDVGEDCGTKNKPLCEDCNQLEFDMSFEGPYGSFNEQMSWGDY